MDRLPLARIVTKRSTDVQAAAEEVLAHNWTEHTGKKGYRKFRCPCGKHMKTIKTTPSGANYVKNLMAWFRRQPCWKEEGED
jgi:hypothetical protein